MIPADAMPILSIVGSVGIVSAALALGLRHGIDWDHIAAITDITSTTAELPDSEKWLTGEPGVMLTDESHHSIGHSHDETATAVIAATGGNILAVVNDADGAAGTSAAYNAVSLEGGYHPFNNGPVDPDTGRHAFDTVAAIRDWLTGLKLM